MLKKHQNLLTTGPVAIHGKIVSRRVDDLNEEIEDKQSDLNGYQQVPEKEYQPYMESEVKSIELTPEMIEKLTILGKEIMKQWDIEVSQIEVIQGAQMALVWKVTTPDGPVCLKRMNRPEKKALFSIYAQNHLAEKGAHVPSIIITKEKQLYAKHGPFLFVVYEWIEGRPFDLSISEDVAWMMKGLAEYHLNSQGYRPPEGIQETSKLGQWPKHYTKRCKQMESWKLIAAQQPNDPFSQLYLETIDEFIEQGWD
ncbi:MAG TPA: phosphotransferase, partial [Bacillales bacterium]|nr:phosphotransferase [Bacillales bacterium]